MDDLSKEARIAIATIELIQYYSGRISELDADTTSDQDEIKERMHGLQEHENDLVNRLKADGITIEYDSPVISVLKHGLLWLRYGWHEYETEKAATEPALANRPSPDFWQKDWRREPVL